jgi:hypothetical protein
VVRKAPFWRRFYSVKPIILPRQARDKHRENSEKEMRVFRRSIQLVTARNWKDPSTYVLEHTDLFPNVVSERLFPLVRRQLSLNIMFVPSLSWQIIFFFQTVSTLQ